MDQPTILDAVLSFLLAGTVSFLLVPLTKPLAERLGAIDMPNPRGLHQVPTPRLGGLAILAGVLLAGVIWMPGDGESRAILAGAVVITAVGALDDVVELNAAWKLLGQTVAVTIPVAAGVKVEDIAHMAIEEDLDLSDHMNDGVKSLKIVLAADRSIHEGQVIRL